MEGRGGGRKLTTRLCLEDVLQFGKMLPLGKLGHRIPPHHFPQPHVI